MERNLRSLGIEHEPPGIPKYSRAANVDTNDHVAKEQPRTDEWFTTVPRRQAHDGVVGRVEAESCRRKTVRDEVDPQKLNRDESLGHSKKDSQEDRNNLSDVRRD